MEPKTPEEIIENVLEALYEFAEYHATPEWNDEFFRIWPIFQDIEDSDEINYALERLTMLMERKAQDAE